MSSCGAILFFLLLAIALAEEDGPAKYQFEGRFEEHLRQPVGKGRVQISPCDIRVAKGLGSKGYNWVRLSVVSHVSG